MNKLKFTRHNKGVRLMHQFMVMGLLIFLHLIAQGKGTSSSSDVNRTLSFNPGIAFSGSGDAAGIGSEISYQRNFNSWLYHKETLSSWIVNGDNWYQEAKNNQTGIDLLFLLGIAPFHSETHALSLMGGICVGSARSIHPNGGGGWGIGNSSYYEYFINKYDKQLDAGFAIGASYQYFASTKLTFNLSASFRGYAITGNAISIMSFGIGYRIN
ncbi:MAG: hypothetical protein ACERKD_09505 [Prolixibacteraceae bacterium]